MLLPDIMSYETDPKNPRRDLRLDLFRGLANWAIFLDHVPNNVVAWITVRNYGFSDAAELFVFVSGFTVAFVYTKVMQKKNFLAATVGIYGSVWKIYVAYILLLVFYVVTIGYVVQRYGHAHLLDEFNIRRLIADPVEFLKHGLLLQYSPLNLDVLPLYIALMAPLPPVLWLLVKSPNCTLAASVMLYVIARQLGWNLPAYPSGGWYFNPFAWQLLFVIGAWASITDRDVLERNLRSGVITSLAVAFLVFSAIVTVILQKGYAEALPEAVVLIFSPNDKTNLAPYRIAHFLALAVIVARLISKDAKALKWPILRPVMVCGQQSLEVFCTGVFLAFVAYFLVHLISDTFAFQFLISILGIALMVMVAYFRRWSKEGAAKPS